jgi:hypothetical protein
VPTSLIGRISQCGLGIAYIIALAACGASDQRADSAITAVPPATARAADAPMAEPAGSIVPATSPPAAAAAEATDIPTVPATQPPTATPKETIVPDKKPTQPPIPARPTLQLRATLVPEGAAPLNTPIGAAPAPAIAQTAPVEAAKADLARRRAVAPDTIRIVEVRDVIWPDLGLGCPQPGMLYKQVQVDGLLIRLESGGQLFEYHSGGGKPPFLCEQPAQDKQSPPGSGGGDQ